MGARINAAPVAGRLARTQPRTRGRRRLAERGWKRPCGAIRVVPRNWGDGHGSGSGLGLNQVPARDHVAGGELFRDHAGQRGAPRGYRLARRRRAGRPRTAWVCGWHTGRGRRARRLPGTPLRGGSISGPCRFNCVRMRLYHGSGNRNMPLAQQDGELALAPAGIALAQIQDAMRQKTGPQE